MIPFLAETTGGVDGELVLKIIGAIFSGVLLLLGGRHLGKKESQGVTLHPPVPRFGVDMREDPEFVTNNQLNVHLERIESTFDEIKNALDGERSIARTANGNLHKRIDAMSEKFGDRLSNLEGTSRGVKETVDKLLDIALGKVKPPTRP
jgi:hypothetical protein